MRMLNIQTFLSDSNTTGLILTLITPFYNRFNNNQDNNNNNNNNNHQNNGQEKKMFIFKCLHLYCTLIENAFSLSIRLCSSWSITIERQKPFYFSKIRPKAKLLMMLNLTTIDHYVNDSDIVSIISIKVRIRIVTQ